MKKLFGKILVGAIGCAMALGINAFAANELTITKIDPNKNTLEVTIEGTIKGDAASLESTILVAPADVSLLENVNDGNIKYINQETVDQDGKFVYTFKLPEATKYNVWFGGTDITAPGQDVINFADDTFKIVGTVNVEYEYEKDPAKSYNDVTVVAKPIAATDAEGKKTYGESVSGTVSAADKQFTVEVAAGTYDVVVGKPGYLYKTASDVAVAADVTLADVFNLIAGEVYEDGYITLTDITEVVSKVGAVEGDGAYEAKYDFDDDGYITITDVTVVVLNNGAQAQ